MTLNYTAVQALINKKYMPVLNDLIFKANHYLTRKMRDNAKTFNGRKIVVPLEYADSTSNVQFTSEYEVLDLKPVDPFTAAEYTPKMLTGHLTISKEDELIANSDQAVKNLVQSKVKNLQKSIERVVSLRMFDRGTTSAKEWFSLNDLIGVATIGGIPATGAVPDWWKSNVLDNTSYSDDCRVEGNVADPTKDCFILKILQKNIAVCKYQTGEMPDTIICTQYIWDLLESVLEGTRKTGNKMDDKAGAMGFTALNYRGIAIVADEDLAEAQSADNDGYMYFINMNYMYMYFNSKAKFTAGKFIEAINQNAMASKVHAFGNSVISNRGVMSVQKDLYSPKTYSGAYYGADATAVTPNAFDQAGI